MKKKNELPFVENPIRIDPYELTFKAITSKNYKECAKILKGKRSVREQASFPTALLHIDSKMYEKIIEGIKKHCAEKELLYCFKIARSLARQFHDSFDEKTIETILSETELEKNYKLLPYAEFRHIQEVYRYEPRFPS